MTFKVLFVLTSHGVVEKTEQETGWHVSTMRPERTRPFTDSATSFRYLPELAHPYEKLAPHAEIVMASPAGGKAPVNLVSVETSTDAVSRRIWQENGSLWANTEKLENFKAGAHEFDAIFFVGGAVPMFDIADNPTSHQIIREFYEAGKVVSAVCHGVAAVAKVQLSDESYLISGQKVTGLRYEEEKDTGLIDVLPFLLETKLRENVGSSGSYDSAAPWSERVVVSGREGNLITGQNPASAGHVGEAILEALRSGA